MSDQREERTKEEVPSAVSAIIDAAERVIEAVRATEQLRREQEEKEHLQK